MNATSTGMCSPSSRTRKTARAGKSTGTGRIFQGSMGCLASCATIGIDQHTAWHRTVPLDYLLVGISALACVIATRSSSLTSSCAARGGGNGAAFEWFMSLRLSCPRSWSFPGPLRESRRSDPCDRQDRRTSRFLRLLPCRST